MEEEYNGQLSLPTFVLVISLSIKSIPIMYEPYYGLFIHDVNCTKDPTLVSNEYMNKIKTPFLVYI